MTRIALSYINPQSPRGVKYREWLQHFSPSVQLIECNSFATVSQAVQELESCHALVLTGGADIAPERYNSSDPLGICDVEPERDTLEFALLEAALQRKMPILGICRGSQLLNVALGGSLIRDIPSEVPSSTTEHRSVNKQDSIHTIEIPPGSILHKIIGSTSATVNSAHHQAAYIVPEVLTVAASSPTDNIIEAIEWAQPMEQASFLVGVQWHPERMEYENPASGNIAQRFLFEADTFAELFG